MARASAVKLKGGSRRRRPRAPAAPLACTAATLLAIAIALLAAVAAAAAGVPDSSGSNPGKLHDRDQARDLLDLSEGAELPPVRDLFIVRFKPEAAERALGRRLLAGEDLGAASQTLLELLRRRLGLGPQLGGPSPPRAAGKAAPGSGSGPSAKAGPVPGETAPPAPEPLFEVRDVYRGVFPGFSARMGEDVRAAAEADDAVLGVWRDVPASIAALEQSSPPWNLDRIDQDAWSSGGDRKYSYSASGCGVNVYVIDSGIFTEHPEFEGRARNIIDATGENFFGDCSGHGTHVAGTIGSRTYGAAKQATIYGLRVFGCNGRGSGSAILSSMDWVIANHVKPAIMSMSLKARPAPPRPVPPVKPAII
eukprot:tig00020902_g14962.t1